MPLSEAHLAAKSMSKFATCQEVDTPEYPCLYVAFLLSVVQYPASLRHEKRKQDSQWPCMVYGTWQRSCCSVDDSTCLAATASPTVNHQLPSETITTPY
jgi:hypothetical protein